MSQIIIMCHYCCLEAGKAFKVMDGTKQWYPWSLKWCQSLSPVNAAWISPELAYESIRTGGKPTDVHSFMPKGFMDTLYLNWSNLIIDEYLWEKQADL